MIIKNRQERSNAIWKFVAIVGVCTLAIFLVGFTLGNVRDQEQTDMKHELDKCMANQEKVKISNTYLIRLDSLQKLIQVTTTQLAATIPPPDNVFLQGEWNSKLGQFSSSISADISRMQGELLAQKAPQELKSAIELLYSYLKSQTVTLEMQKKISDSNKSNANTQMDPQMIALNNQIVLLQVDVRNRDAALQQCQAQKQSAGGGGGGGSRPAPENTNQGQSSAPPAQANNNPTHITAIQGSITEIRDIIIPKIKNPLFKNNDPQLQLLRSKLDAIMDASRQIK